MSKQVCIAHVYYNKSSNGITFSLQKTSFPPHSFSLNIITIKPKTVFIKSVHIVVVVVGV